MENPTPFDLNDAIQRWREGLSQSPQFREENLAELEAHLRDATATWQSRGLTQEEAFWVAARRLGDSTTLGAEFAKINRSEVWLSRALWMLVGIQLWAVLGSFARFGADAAVLGGLAGLGYNFPSYAPGPQFWRESLLPTALFSLSELVVLVGCIAGCCWLVYRNGQRVHQVMQKGLRRPVIAGVVISALLLGIFFFRYTEGWIFHYHYSVSTWGAISVARTLAGSLLLILQTVGLVALTILLLRRLRLRTSS